MAPIARPGRGRGVNGSAERQLRRGGNSGRLTPPRGKVWLIRYGATGSYRIWAGLPHITARGNERGLIFRDDQDREQCLETSGEGIPGLDW